MNRVAILGKNANDFLSGLQIAANAKHLDLVFEAFLEPSHLYARLEHGSPLLVLLHQTWEGLDPAQIAGVISVNAPQAVVVIYTGGEPRLVELISCVRSGIADCWKTGEHSIDSILNRICQYFAEDSHQIGRLKMASQPMLRLMQQTEELQARTAEMVTTISNLKAELEEFEALERRESIRDRLKILTVVIYFITLTVCIGALKMWAKMDTLPLLGSITIVSLLLLFLGGFLTSAVFKWGEKVCRYQG